MKIYTKTGDKGTTSLYSGERVSKCDTIIRIVGKLDSVNSAIGAAWSEIQRSLSENNGAREPFRHLFQHVPIVMHRLFELGSVFATRPMPVENFNTDKHTLELEEEIDRITSFLPPLHQFVLPNNSFHVARAECRRFERSLHRYLTRHFACQRQANNTFKPIPSEICFCSKFVNRLSDFLFTIARAQALVNNNEVLYVRLVDTLPSDSSSPPSSVDDLQISELK